MLLGFLPSLGGGEIVLLLVLGILLFGRKLPELGRIFGRTVTQFKMGVKGIEDEVESAGASGASRTAGEPEPVRPPQRVTASAPKFDDAPATPNTTPALPPKV